MSRNGLYIEYEYCTGCYTCEVACQQEHDYPAGKRGIKITEFVLETFNDKPSIFYLPFPTDLCNLCVERTIKGEKPSCVKHCQANCMIYGSIDELSKEMNKTPRSVIFAPR